MKTSNDNSNMTNDPPRHASGAWQNLVLVALIGTSLNLTIRAAEVPAANGPAAPAPDASVQGVQVLTRGPVHEAFAGIVTYNPEPGIVVAKAPPEMIEEVPPGERPEGNNVTWIPGYWAWDEERSDFIWISGTWRALPPGRQWMAGYWGETTQGYQWTSGYWADAATQETTYLPQPLSTRWILLGLCLSKQPLWLRPDLFPSTLESSPGPGMGSPHGGFLPISSG